MNTALTEAHALLVAAARQQAASHVAPRAAEIDQGSLFPHEPYYDWINHWGQAILSETA